MAEKKPKFGDFKDLDNIGNWSPKRIEQFLEMVDGLDGKHTDDHAFGIDYWPDGSVRENGRTQYWPNGAVRSDGRCQYWPNGMVRKNGDREYWPNGMVKKNGKMSYGMDGSVKG